MKPARAVVVRDGRRPYVEVLSWQRAWAAGVVAEKLPPALWLGEHPPVITLGLRATPAEITVEDDHLAACGFEVVAVERGRLATLHAPGQLVAYLIYPVRAAGLGVRELVSLLESAMIEALARLGLPAGRDPRNPGVWAAGRKVGFVGLAIRRGVSLHGLALNLNLDPDLFACIVPCGLRGVEVSSAARLLGRPAEPAVAADAVAETLLRELGLDGEGMDFPAARELAGEAGF